MPKYSYRDEMGQIMVEMMAADKDVQPVWWADCPHCDYEGPEPPLPGLEPRPGFHEVWLCPSCKGRLEVEHPQVKHHILSTSRIELRDPDE